MTSAIRGTETDESIEKIARPAEMGRELLDLAERLFAASPETGRNGVTWKNVGSGSYPEVTLYHVEQGGFTPRGEAEEDQYQLVIDYTSNLPRASTIFRLVADPANGDERELRVIESQQGEEQLLATFGIDSKRLLNGTAAIESYLGGIVEALPRIRGMVAFAELRSAASQLVELAPRFLSGTPERENDPGTRIRTIVTEQGSTSLYFFTHARWSVDSVIPAGMVRLVIEGEDDKDHLLFSYAPETTERSEFLEVERGMNLMYRLRDGKIDRNAPNEDAFQSFAEIVCGTAGIAKTVIAEDAARSGSAAAS